MFCVCVVATYCTIVSVMGYLNLLLQLLFRVHNDSASYEALRVHEPYRIPSLQSKILYIRISFIYRKSPYHYLFLCDFAKKQGR